MKFSEVIPYLTENKKARGSTWEPGSYIMLDPFNGDILSWHVPREPGVKNVYPFELDLEDLSRDDWEIIG